MRNITFRLIIAIATFFAGLTLVAIWFFHSNLPEVVSKNSAKNKDSNNVILEISTDIDGPVSPNGHILDFRLYENGRLQYDIYPANTSDDKLAPSVPIRKESHLSESEVKELIELAEQSNFLNGPNEYPGFLRPGRDFTIKTTIVFKHLGREKRVVVWDHSPDNLEAKNHYPAALIKLFQRVSELRSAKVNQ